MLITFSLYSNSFLTRHSTVSYRRQGGDGEELEEYNAGSQERETTLNQLLIELDGFVNLQLSKPDFCGDRVIASHSLRFSRGESGLN